MAFVYREEQVNLGFGRGWLSRPAAESIFRIDDQIGHPLQVTESGRTWKQQWDFWVIFQNGGPIALHPDTPSEHQKGKAIDSNEAQRILQIMEDNGWRRTVYRWVNGVWTLVERWHFEYFPHLDNRRNNGQVAGKQEDVMNADQERKLDTLSTDVANIKGFLYAGGTDAENLSFQGKPGTVLQMLRNVQAHLFFGGKDALKPDYLAAPGTIYHLLKSRVLRSSKSRPTALPEDGAPVFVDQIQDNADTNTLLRELIVAVGELKVFIENKEK